MSRIWLLPVAVLLAAGTASAAETAGDTASAVMSECSAVVIPAATVDSCLERVRILEETQSSPGLATLEARLEARVASDHEPVGAPSAGRDVEVRPYSAGQGAGSEVDPAVPVDSTQASAGAFRSPGSEGSPAGPADSATNGGEGGSAALDDPAAANSPPEVTPDDEPPIADPPDTDEVPRMGDEATPPRGAR